MAMTDEIAKAIGAHGLWKQRLREAIAQGTFEMTPTQLEADNQCAFGKWLHGLTGPEARSPMFERVRILHVAFHKEAAKVLRLALAGSSAEASKALAEGGAFALASVDLTLAMMEWRKALAV